jgi:hypothetical protein
MMGVFAGGDLRTYQSALSERLRYLPVAEVAQLLHHVRRAQEVSQRDIIRASEELADSRLRSSARGKQALQRLTGTDDPALESFLDSTENQILYDGGRWSDPRPPTHYQSYTFLRDRPTVRPGGWKDQGTDSVIASMIRLRATMSAAIAHNQAHKIALGIPAVNGSVQALTFARHESVDGDPETFIADRNLSHLPSTTSEPPRVS